MSERLRIATLNLRNASDRWLERAPMLIEQFVELAADAIGVQEIHVPTRQGEWIVRKVNAQLPPGARPYTLHQVNKTGLERVLEGIGVITRLGVVAAEPLDLRGGHRVAQRVRLRTPGGRLLDVYNTHLHHKADAGELRLVQARLIVDWIAQHHDAPAILVGDLNATRGSLPVALVCERMGSAYALAHGKEPAGTVPTPLNHEWGQPPKTIDYIFVDRRVRVHDARIVFDRIDPGDERLCASDHYGIVADLSLE